MLDIAINHQSDNDYPEFNRSISCQVFMAPCKKALFREIAQTVRHLDLDYLKLDQAGGEDRPATVSIQLGWRFLDSAR